MVSSMDMASAKFAACAALPTLHRALWATGLSLSLIACVEDVPSLDSGNGSASAGSDETSDDASGGTGASSAEGGNASGGTNSGTSGSNSGRHAGQTIVVNVESCAVAVMLLL